MDAYVFEGDLYCEDCKPEGAEGYMDDGGEADTPQHCATCMVPLENPLTGEGVTYVIEAIHHALSQGPSEWLKVYDTYKGTYYEDSPHITIVRDWAEQIRGYGLSEDDTAMVDEFLERTAKAAGVASLGDAIGDSGRFEFEIEPNWESIYGFQKSDGTWVIYQKRHGGDDKFLYSYDDRIKAYLAARRIAHQERRALRSVWLPHEFLTEWSDGDPDPANEMELYIFYIGKQDHLGKEVLAYRFYDGPYMIFEGKDFACSPVHAIDSPEAISSLLSFLSLQKGDTDAEYFEDYSKEQIEWRDTRAEDLANSLMDFQSTFGLEESDSEEDEGEDEEKDSPEDYRIGKLSGGLGYTEKATGTWDPHIPESNPQVLSHKWSQLLSGETIVLDSMRLEQLEKQFEDDPNILNLASLPNPDRVGILDQYIVFLKNTNNPDGIRHADFEQNFPAMIIPVLRSHEGLNLHKSYERGIIASNLARVLGVDRDALLHFLTRNHADISLTEENMKKLAVSISSWMRSGRAKFAVN